MNTPLATEYLLDFPDALAAIMEGKRITKLEWMNEGYWGELREDKLMLRKPDGVYYPWTVSYGDLIGNDWIVLK